MVEIVKKLVPESKYSIKCPYSMTPTRIVVHNTANDASAENEIAYMTRNDYETSFHYAVDHEKIVQGLPLDRNGWHASDGNGKGNREGIAIEICYSKSGGDKFIKAEQNAADLIAYLLKEYGWGIDKVTKHQDYTNKYCPHRTLDMGWDRFLNMIKERMNESTDSSTETTTNTGTTGTITYQAYAGYWLPEVHKCDNTSDGYAGIYGTTITGFRCKPQYGTITYEAHLLGGNWIGAVNSTEYANGTSNDYAGIYGRAIDGIRIKSSQGWVKYRVHLKGGDWLPWAEGFGSSGDLYAGIYGREIDGIQMY